MAQTATSTQPQTQTPSHSASPVFARFTRSKLAFALRGGGGEPSSSSAAATAGVSRKRYTDDNDDEWYIPYNGPISEPPPGMGKDGGMASGSGSGVGLGLGPSTSGVGRFRGDARDTRVRDSWGDVLEEKRAVTGGGGVVVGNGSGGGGGGGVGAGRVGGVGIGFGVGVGAGIGLGAGLSTVGLAGSAHGHSSTGHSRLSVATSSAEDHHDHHHQQHYQHHQPHQPQPQQTHAHFASPVQETGNKLTRGRSRTRDRAMSASSSRYTDSTGVASPVVPPRNATTLGHGNNAHMRLPVPSFLNLDQNTIGIGESPVPVQRGGAHAHMHGHGLGHGVALAATHSSSSGQEHASTSNFGPDLVEFGPVSSSREGKQGHAHTSSQQTNQTTPSTANPTHISMISSAPSASALIGATPNPPSSFPGVPKEKEHQRGSFASFWTFGGTRKSPTAQGAHMTRPSVETFWSRSTSTHGTGVVGSTVGTNQKGSVAAPGSRVGNRERAATIDDKHNLLGQVVDIHPSATSTRPRANTSGGHHSARASPQQTWELQKQASSSSLRLTIQEQALVEEDVERDRESLHQSPPLYGTHSPTSPLAREPVSSGSDEAESPYQRVPHPYAVAFPNKGHREHSRLFATTKGEKQPPGYNELRVPVLNLVSRFSNTSSNNAVPLHLKNQPNKLIKSSISTPNLRTVASSRNAAYGRLNGGSQPITPGFGTKWLSAETWCDALIFPRPRFKVRAAHPISPPDSPLQDPYLSSGPHSAPLEHNEKIDMTSPPQPRVLKKSASREKGSQDTLAWLKTPTSAPPQFSSPTPPLIISAPPLDEKPKAPVRPPRPKSFAQDDLALPSPAPSLSTVIREGAKLEKERDMWKKEATTSFANKRSRSLSRSRMRAMTFRRKESEEDLATSFDMLATRAILGSQAAKPTISAPNSTTSRSVTNTTSFGTISSHSRKSSGVSHRSRGHSRKESWGRTVVKTATGGLCTFAGDALISPTDDKTRAVDGTFTRENMKYGKATDRDDDREDGEGGVMLIGPHTMPKDQLHPQKRVVVTSPSPTPSYQTSTGHTGIGVAISTPLLQPTNPAIVLPDHPYASMTNKRTEDVPRASEYAGPHPTSAKIIDLQLNGETMTDVSLRHRLPPSAARMYAANMLHPYANVPEARQKPTLQMPSHVSPSQRMFAQVKTGEVREIEPDEIQYSPYSQPSPSKTSPAYSTDALGVEEALNVALQRGAPSMNADAMNRDDIAGEVVVHAEQEELDYEKLTPLRSSSRLAVLPRQEEEEERDSWQNVPNSAAMRSNISKESSPGQMSLDSSPVTSPRHFITADDADEYNDLFYRPGRPSNDDFLRTSTELVKGIMSRETSGDAPPGSPPPASISALQNLTRQLSEEYGSQLDDDYIFGRDEARGHKDDYRGSQDGDAINGQHISASPPGSTLPLRLQASRPMSFSTSPLIPEDVESSRASSILERSEDPHDGTVVFQRVGEVEALATPNPTAIQQGPNSARGSYIEDLPSHTNDSSRAIDIQNRTKRRPNLPSLVVPGSASEGTRASYVTSISDASRISQLSDFPVPPHLDTMTPSYMVQSFYEELDQEAINNKIRNHRHPERRTTFGPDTDLPPLESDDH